MTFETKGPTHPTADNAALAQDNEQRLDVAYAAVLAPSHCDTAELRQQNAMAYLDLKLPPEILMNVFRYLSPSCCKDIRTTHVCTLWRELIRSTPEFWADMLSSQSVFYRLNRDAGSDLSVMSFIQRSSPLPYPLCLDSRLEFIETILPHVHRISSLSFTLRFKYKPAAHLVLLPGSAFPSLRTLIVGDPVNHTVPLLDFLNACPQLEVLELHLSEDTRSSNLTLLHNHSPVSLPCLRRCYIRDDLYSAQHTWIPVLLQRIRFPAKTKLRVSCSYGRYIRICSYLPFSPSVPTIPALDVLELRFVPMGKSRPGDWILSMKGRRRRSEVLSMVITAARWGPADASSGPSDVLFDLAKVFSHEPSISLAVLDLEFGIGVSVLKGDWLSILQAVPTLAVLKVHINSCNNLLTVLRKNVGLCPVLRTLSITCENGSGVHGALVTVVELRTQEGHGLESLMFRGTKGTPLSVGRRERLKTLVPHVDIS
ncbi:hypothetical protein L226DRAFT_538712 [Lentinus tigrinus ALCF2SS1-7]|uniref:F-box domain-containing protein n=1 Tax=Lentinus tigrinus ALCF2SS1-6 TaxID=1328759 RepID=A0A5C2RX72_9APHY|nr:hypothetical protein L227DRAFT_603531 [Lentinus tigrinus ALCF2SS1-6]RPD70667.1 hypothetical protein L226DRAFT_538712 [Lentinus tigrinus ALCF2SS1-7]